MFSTPIMTTVSVPQGTPSVVLLSASEAAAIPNRRADDRWVWWFTPEHALVSSATHHRQRVEEVAGPRALSLVEPDAESAGLYTLERVAVSRDDTREYANRPPDWSIRVRVTARHHVHAAADITLAERGDVAQWLCWPGGPPSVDEWERAFALFREHVNDARRRALDQGVAALPRDRLSVYLRLFGLRADGTSGVWLHAADPTRTLHANGLPPTGPIDTISSFAQLQPLLLRREVLSVVAEVASNLLRIHRAHGPWIRADTPGVWVAEDGEGTTVAVHELHPIEPPALVLHGTTAGTSRPWIVSPTLAVVDVYVSVTNGKVEESSRHVNALVNRAPAFTRTRWYAIPFRVADDKPTSRLHALIAALSPLVTERALRAPAHEGDDAFVLDTHATAASGFVSTALLDGAHACVALVAFTEQDTPSPPAVMSIASTTLIPAYRATGVMTPFDVDAVACAPARAHYSAVIPPVTRLPVPPVAQLFSTFRWRRLAGVTFVVFRAQLPPVVEPPPSLGLRYSKSVLAQHREELRAELQHALYATPLGRDDDYASPRTDRATLLPMVVRTYSSRRNAHLALAWYAARHRISYGEAIDVWRTFSVAQLADECDLHRMMGTLDAVFLPVSVEPALAIATERLEAVPVFAPHGDGLSDAFLWLLRWGEDHLDRVPTMDTYRDQLIDFTARPAYPPLEAFDALTSDVVMARWIDERADVAARVMRERAERALPEWLTRRRPALAVIDRPLMPLIREIADDPTTLPVDRRVCAHVTAAVSAFRDAFAATTPPGSMFASAETVTEKMTLRDMPLARVASAVRAGGNVSAADALLRFERLPVHLFPYHYTAADIWRVVPIGGPDKSALALACETFYLPPTTESAYAKRRARLERDPRRTSGDAVDRARALRDIALRTRCDETNVLDIITLYLSETHARRTLALEEFRASSEKRWVAVQEARVAAWFNRADRRSGCRVQTTRPPTVTEFFEALASAPFPAADTRAFLSSRAHYLEQSSAFDDIVCALYSATTPTPGANAVVDTYRAARQRSRDTIDDWDGQHAEDKDLYAAAFPDATGTIAVRIHALKESRQMVVGDKHRLFVEFGRYLLCFVHRARGDIEAAAKHVANAIAVLETDATALAMHTTEADDAITALQRRVDAQSGDYTRVMAAWTPALAAALYREITGSKDPMPAGWMDDRVRALARATMVTPLGSRAPAAVIRDGIRAGTLAPLPVVAAGAFITPGSEAVTDDQKRRLAALLAIHALYRETSNREGDERVAAALKAVTNGDYTPAYDAHFAAMSDSLAAALLSYANTSEPLPAEEQIYDRHLHAVIGTKLAGMPGPYVIADGTTTIRVEFAERHRRRLNTAWPPVGSASTDVAEWSKIIQSAALAAWHDVMDMALKPYRGIVQQCLEAVSKREFIRVGFPAEIDLLQQRFFRPSPRESSGVVGAVNTVFAADPDATRDETALPRVVWKQRLAVVKAMPELPVATAGVWTPAERTRMIVHQKTDVDLARAAIRWAIRDFYTHEVVSSAVVPAAALELLIWSLLSDVGFLEMRRRYAFDQHAGVHSPFAHIVAHWQLPSDTPYMVVDQRQASALIDAVLAESPKALDPLATLAEKSYRMSPRRDTAELWRLVVFGRASAPSVFVLAADQDTSVFPITIREAAELAQFVVDLDTQVFAAVKRITDADDAQRALLAADRLLLMHTVFTFLLGYVAPRDPNALLFVQQQHPDGTVMFDHFHGQAVREIASQVYGLAVAARPITLAWYEEFARLMRGTLYTSEVEVMDGAPLVNEFVDYVLWPYIRESTVRRRLFRVERSANPFDPAADLIEGTASAVIANTLTGDENKVFRTVAPLERISVKATFAHPEGEDTAYSADETDFTPDPQFSFYEWRVGRVCFLRPSKARQDECQTKSLDNALDEKSFAQTIIKPVGFDQWQLSNPRFPELLLVPQTGVLRWFETWRRYGYTRRPMREDLDNAAMPTLEEELDGVPLTPPINRVQITTLYDTMMAELFADWLDQYAEWEVALGDYDPPLRTTYDALLAALQTNRTAADLTEQKFVADRARVTHFRRGLHLYTAYLNRVMDVQEHVVAS